MVNDLLLLFEQQVAISLGYDVVGSRQLAVMDFPFIEKLEVPNCPAPVGRERFWADESWNGWDWHRWLAAGAFGLERRC